MVPQIIDPFGWPAEMVAQIAIGMEQPVDIAFRYGYKASEYQVLEQNKAFAAEVAAKRAEYERDGYSVEIKTRWMVGNLLDDYFIRLKDSTTTLGQLEAGVNTMARLAGLGQKKVDQAPAAAGSSIQIIFNGSQAGEVTIGGTTIATDTTERVWSLPDPGPVTDVESTDVPD